MKYENEAFRGLKLIGWLFLLSTVLVASHKGEFWPFSIYPMFSQAGNSWSRALLIEIEPDDTTNIWDEKPLGSIDQRNVVPVKRLGVDQIDYSNFISKTEHWTPGRINAIKTLFPEQRLQGRTVMATKATGKLVRDDSVSVILLPMFLINADTIRVNPVISIDPPD